MEQEKKRPTGHQISAHGLVGTVSRQHLSDHFKEKIRPAKINTGLQLSSLWHPHGCTQIDLNADLHLLI